jgi:hypothetical protein
VWADRPPARLPIGGRQTKWEFNMGGKPSSRVVSLAEALKSLTHGDRAREIHAKINRQPNDGCILCSCAGPAAVSATVVPLRLV